MIEVNIGIRWIRLCICMDYRFVFCGKYKRNTICRSRCFGSHHEDTIECHDTHHDQIEVCQKCKDDTWFHHTGIDSVCADQNYK